MSATLVSPGTRAVLRTEARLFGREVASIFWIVLFPVALLCVMGLIPGFREPDPNLGGMRVVDLYVPISVLLSMIMAAIMAMPPVVFAYREAGVLRRLQTTPVKPLTLLAAQVGLHGIAVAASSVLLLVVGRLVLGTPVPGAMGWYVIVYLLALVTSFGLGAVVMAISPNARVGTAVGMVVFFPSMFTAGVYYPIQAMGGAVREIVELTPLGAASQAMYQAMAGSMPDLKLVAVMVGWSIVFYAIAARTFRWQ